MVRVPCADVDVKRALSKEEMDSGKEGSPAWPQRWGQSPNGAGRGRGDFGMSQSYPGPMWSQDMQGPASPDKLGSPGNDIAAHLRFSAPGPVNGQMMPGMMMPAHFGARSEGEQHTAAMVLQAQQQLSHHHRMQAQMHAAAAASTANQLQGQNPWEHKQEFGMLDLSGMASLSLNGHRADALGSSPQQQRRAGAPGPSLFGGGHGGGLPGSAGLPLPDDALLQQGQGRAVQGPGFSFHEQGLKADLRHGGARGGPAGLAQADEMLLNMGHLGVGGGDLLAALDEGGAGGAGVGALEGLPLPVEAALRLVGDEPAQSPFGAGASPAHAGGGGLPGLRSPGLGQGHGGIGGPAGSRFCEQSQTFGAGGRAGGLNGLGSPQLSRLDGGAGLGLGVTRPQALDFADDSSGLGGGGGGGGFGGGGAGGGRSQPWMREQSLTQW